MTGEQVTRRAEEEAPSAYAFPLLLKHLLASGVARAPEQEIVYRDIARFDYQTLAKRVAKLANSLSDLGIGVGDTVGVLDWDSNRYLESYFAIPGIGAVLHMVNIRLSPEQILYTINHARDDALLVHADFLPMLEGIWDRIENVRAVIVLTDMDEIPATALPIKAEYEAMLSMAESEYLFPDFDENMRATTFYTTGTTGLPKGVFFSHRQLVLHSLVLAGSMAAAPVQGRLHRSDIYMPITPMFHVHAWGLPFIATMLGLKQVYPGRYAPASLLALQQAEGVTFSHCVPTLLQMLLTSAEATDIDLRGWKIVIGGAALPKALVHSALERGIDIFAGYGMSETCPVLSIAQLTEEQLADESAQMVEARTRAGRPVPLVDLRIVDAEMKPLPRDGKSAGEIVVRAPWLTQAYSGDPASSAMLWEGGYLHTGDVGVLHPDGTLQITDRVKDLIKTGGEWISSLEIEDLISQLEGVSEVAVIAVPDLRWGERPLAVVVGTAGLDSLTEAMVKAHIKTFCERGQISKWAVPERVMFQISLDKTSVGKLDKKKLREQYCAPALSNHSG